MNVDIYQHLQISMDFEMYHHGFPDENRNIYIPIWLDFRIYLGLQCPKGIRIYIPTWLDFRDPLPGDIVLHT